MDLSNVVADSDNKVKAVSVPVSSSDVSKNDSKMDRTEIDHDQADSTEHDITDGPEGMVATEQDHGNERPKPSSFLGFQLSSDQNQIYSLTRKLESFKSEEKKLLRKRAAVNSGLETVRKKQKLMKAQIDERQESMRVERNAAGISDELWREYEAFCESLQLDDYKQSRLFAWDESCNDSYSEYDPDFESLCSAVGGKSGCWRCECVATFTKSGKPIGFQVDYYALPAPIESTWGMEHPRLYDGAVEAAKKGSAAALEMLVALPSPSGRIGRGWAFEFGFEESRSSHPDLSQRWGFRAAHDLRASIATESKRNSLIQRYRLPFEIEWL
ncbi:hypothetical protein F5Y07DRAFT_394367 [Xylaria sp. FL0933]|nr:hypothetical protein F5Y07DRAFT_394367 [Xylaria sp. FL0933]